MMKNIFKPNKEIINISILSCAFGISGFILFCILLKQNVAIYIRVFYVFLLFVSVYLSVLLILYPLQARLVLLKNGILYRHPFYSILCNWVDIEDIVIVRDNLKIIYKKEILKEKNRFMKILIDRSIPVGNFVKSYKKEEDWDTSLLLIALKDNLAIPPYRIKEIFK